MKKSLHITGLISITLLYCFATAFCSGMALKGNGIFTNINGAEKKSYSYSVSAKSFQHIAQTENSVTVCGYSYHAPQKTSYNNFLAFNQLTEQLAVHTFLQYNFYSNNLLARLQNTDLIYPFHYFW